MAGIGLLGGTFDPIHNVHLMLGRQALSQLSLSKVILVPNGSPPHKSAAVASGADRLAMVKLAIAGVAGLCVSDYEIKKKRPGYSVELVEHFRALYPDDVLYFILGADSLDYIDRWYDGPRLLTLCRFAVAVRGGFSADCQKKIESLRSQYGAQIVMLDAAPHTMASAQIRQAAARGEDIAALVPEPVCRYIISHGLYRA